MMTYFHVKKTPLSSAVRQLKKLELVITGGRGKSRLHAVLIGDFNFSDRWEEEQTLHPDYIDVWKALRPREDGFTMPASVRPDRSYDAWRPDHVMLRSDVFRPSQWTWLVKETLEPVAKNVCSSHIYARLRITTVCCLNWNSDLCYNFVSFIR